MSSTAGDHNEPVISLVSALAEDILRSEGMELVDVQYRRESRGMVLRIFIDKPGGITLDDCRAISQQISDHLDVNDVIHYPYNLEVSSPGLNRLLKKESDFERFAGNVITLKTACLIDNKKTFRGRLIGFRDGSVRMEVEGKPVTIPYARVEKAHLEFQFDKQKGH
jgi:ribosome maturation factor RimP